MNDKVMTPGSSLRDEEVRQSLPQPSATRTRQEKIAARKKAFGLILLDALRGSRPYVESYQAGRGAE